MVLQLDKDNAGDATSVTKTPKPKDLNAIMRTSDQEIMEEGKTLHEET